MSQYGFFGAQAHTHNLGRLIRELGVVLGFWSFFHCTFFPIAAVPTACRRTNSLRQSNPHESRELEEEDWSFEIAEEKRSRAQQNPC
jgi:hypothetical protein